MAVKSPGDAPDRTPRGPAPKPVARKPGHVIDTPGEQHEENVADIEHRQRLQNDALQVKEKQTEALKKPQPKGKPDLKDEEKRRGQGGGGGQEQKQSTTAGHLAHDANFYRRGAQKLGFDQTPGLGAVVLGKSEAPTGESLGTLLPSARARAHPSLPEVDLRPPEFLSPLEAMTDIYMKKKGRISRKTKELLESPDLEDLLAMVRKIHDDEALVKKPEARLKGTLFAQLKDDPGPLLLGFQDPRLTEPWRLFLDGWDLWIAGKNEGVELFWEGEAEDDDGEVIQLMQSLELIGGELTLHTQLGSAQDHLTFDGSAFFRLKTARATKSE